MTKNQTDIVIIGAGPSGLFAAFQAGMLGMSSIIVDVLSAAGGQCSLLYPEKPIYDIPAWPIISGQALVDKLLEQNNPFNVNYLLGQSVINIEGDAGNFTVTTSQSVEIQCKAIIIAAGNGLFGPSRPPLDNITNFEDKSVHYYINNRSQFEDKTLVIAGGGDSAVDWAINLSNIAKHIYFLHRRDKFRAHDASVSQLNQLIENGKIEPVIPYQLIELKGEDGYLSEVIVSSIDQNNTRSLKADHLLAFFGLRAELGPLANWGLEIEKSTLIVDPSTMMTTKQGVFAIGDICHYQNKLKLILTGFAEAATACHYAYKDVFPNKALHFEYSTTKGIKHH